MEFVVTMLIANLAAVPMQETGTPLLAGLLPILVVLSVELVLSVLTYRSVGMRRFLCGKPVILIENGRLLQQNLKKTRVNTDELAEYLRIQGVTDLSQVQYAILETSGAISTFLYPKYEPAPAKDAGVQVSGRKLPITVIASGRLMRNNIPRQRSLCGRQSSSGRAARQSSAFSCTTRRSTKFWPCSRSSRRLSSWKIWTITSPPAANSPPASSTSAAWSCRRWRM